MHRDPADLPDPGGLTIPDDLSTLPGRPPTPEECWATAARLLRRAEQEPDGYKSERLTHMASEWTTLGDSLEHRHEQ